MHRSKAIETKSLFTSRYKSAQLGEVQSIFCGGRKEWILACAIGSRK